MFYREVRYQSNSLNKITSLTKEIETAVFLTDIEMVIYYCKIVV